MLKFSLTMERWIMFETKWKGDGKDKGQEPWPYKHNKALEYCAEVFDGKLHIFGGGDEYKCIGMNLHMCLDLRTLIWEQLGGSNKMEGTSTDMPTSRKGAASWVVPREKRMYILYGHAARSEMSEETQHLDHQYEDMWSYSFVERTWKRERRFEAAMDADTRARKLAGWARAVEGVLVNAGG